MGEPTKPPANGVVKVMRKLYHPIGFKKGYNALLWFILSFGMFGFIMARMPYTNFYGVFCQTNSDSQLSALPGECYWYLKPGRYNIGIIMHICTILPGTLLALFQFVPIIRYKAILFHKINGYVIYALSIAGTVGALMVTDKAFGGTFDIQSGAGLLAIMFIVSLVFAYINIKRLQIDQHRIWQLRAWAYAGCILTVRIILILTAIIGTKVNRFYGSMLCAKIDFMMGDQEAVVSAFPGCRSFYDASDPDAQVPVKADYASDNVAEITASLTISFGTALWIGLALHAILVEIYIHLTPAEHLRLKNVSYQRQVAAGYRHPGNAGLTSERLGDAPHFIPEQNGTLGTNDDMRSSRDTSYNLVSNSV